MEKAKIREKTHLNCWNPDVIFYDWGTLALPAGGLVLVSSLYSLSQTLQVAVNIIFHHDFPMETTLPPLQPLLPSVSFYLFHLPTVTSH